MPHVHLAFMEMLFDLLRIDGRHHASLWIWWMVARVGTRGRLTMGRVARLPCIKAEMR